MEEKKDRITVLFVSPTWLATGFDGGTWSLSNLIESIRDRIEPIVLFSRQGEASDFFRREGITVLSHRFTSIFLPSRKTVLFHPWRLQFVKYLRYDLKCVRFVKKAMKGRKVDIVHSNLTTATIGHRIAKALHAKHVWHVRETLGEHVAGVEIAGGMRHLHKMISQADARIVVSDTCLKVWDFPQENTYMFFDAVRRKDACCYEKQKQPYFLFCSAWLTEAKGSKRAIRSFGLSGLAEKGYHLKMVGSKSKAVEDDLKRTAAASHCENAIEFIPYQTDVKPYFVHATAFINASVDEGMGRTTAEAMFYGCPVIALASGGTLNLLKHGENGWLFNTIEECADLLKMVCCTDQEPIISRAQAFAKDNLSIENYPDKIITVYEAALGRSLQE